MVVALVGLVAATAQASSVRVPSDFYGMNLQRLAKLSPEAQDTHLSRIAALGIGQVRINASWAAIEPRAPIAGIHDYRWDAVDQQIAALARHGIRAQPTLTQAPNWDAPQGPWVDLQCAKAASRSPVDVRPYATFVRAFADRYGRRGAFWATHPGVPYAPVLRYEIWNEPNLKGGWCPHPQPSLYADLFVRATKAIRAADPSARVNTGGVAPPSAKNANKPKQYVGIADFFKGVTARRRSTTKLMSGADVHVYPGTDRDKQLDRLGWFRSQLRDGRIPNRIPMVINEIGWATHVGKTPLTEDERAAAYARMTVNYARTNCNLGGLLPHTWISPQQSKSNPEDWYGIANPSTGKPYASALHYSYGLRLMRGQLPNEPPMRTLMACPGMPLPDSDRDGFPDQRDYYPLNPNRH
jgi:cellulase (glycosyl hydrolase family 5)